MRFALLLVCLAGTTALAAEPPRIFRKADGTVCAVSVDASGKLAESCEEKPKPTDAPKAEAAPVLTPPEAPTETRTQVQLLASASLKHGWSGGLKLTAISNAIVGVSYLGAQGGGQWAATYLAAAGLGVVIAIVLDMSAAGDIAEAEKAKR